jgi:hypothetical protein
MHSIRIPIRPMVRDAAILRRHNDRWHKGKE